MLRSRLVLLPLLPLLAACGSAVIDAPPCADDDVACVAQGLGTEDPGGDGGAGPGARPTADPAASDDPGAVDPGPGDDPAQSDDPAPTDDPAPSDDPAPTDDPGGCELCCDPGEQRPCVTACGTGGIQECGPDGLLGACAPPAEQCDDGVDNDCDGAIDGSDLDCPGVTYHCHDLGVGNCNGDLGYGDRCAPQDNEGGCTDEAFFAWCNRRNPDHPGEWDAFVESWVRERCDGPIVESGGQYDTFSCTTPENETYACTTPLVISFEPDRPVRFVAAGHRFPLSPRGEAAVSWPSAATPWLALDRDGDGAIGGGAELFGSATPLRGGGVAGGGFAALAPLDTNGDGRISRADEAWDRLLLFADEDGDGRSSPAELRGVEEAGLLWLELGFTLAPRCSAAGDCERERASVVWRDGAGRQFSGAVIDVHLRLAPPASVSECSGPCRPSSAPPSSERDPA